VLSGHWPLFRFDPRRSADQAFPLTLDSKAPSIPFGDYAYGETRYRVLRSLDPEAAQVLGGAAQHDIDARWALYETLAKR
jgi:pyruvate-ferredoxin/flavodoxin oxidoreductase